MGSGSCSTPSGPGPTRRTGYCVDDVARALQVDLLHGRELGGGRGPTAERGLRFLVEAFDPGSGRLRNFRSIDGSWIGGIGSDDSFGRAVLALGDVIATAPDDRLVEGHPRFSIRSCRQQAEFTSPRAEASVVLACAAVHESAHGGPSAATLTILATRLHDRFRRRSTPEWPWPEVSGDVRERPAPARADRRRPDPRVGADGRHRPALARLAHRGADRARRASLADRQRVVAAGRPEVALRPAADRGDGAAASPRKPPTR